MIKNFEKSSYYSDGTVKTMSSGNHFGDSCYIVGYKATLQKKCNSGNGRQHHRGQ